MRAPLLNGGLQYLLDRSGQLLTTWPRHLARCCLRPDAGKKQGLAGVDVAHTNNGMTIHNELLDRLLTLTATFI